MSPTSVFFQNYFVTGEQNLLQDLVDESIKIHGVDCWYISRSLTNFDKLLESDDQSNYTNAFFIEVYLKTTMGFAGDGNFLSKVAGLEIRDQLVFAVSQRVFTDLIGFQMNFPRPREGDIIYFPLNKKSFQIKYVNKFDSFYQLGQLYTWEMTCELFEYSDETFNTGIPEIDRLQLKFSTNIYDYLIKTNNGTAITLETGDYWVADGYNYTNIDPISDNDTIRKELPTYIDWSETDPFSQTANAVTQEF